MRGRERERVEEGMHVRKRVDVYIEEEETLTLIGVLVGWKVKWA